MSDYTRVTLSGRGRKADLVLPQDEPVAAMLPEVLALLDETQADSSRPVALMTSVGDQLDLSLSLAAQNVAHGTLLRVVPVDEAPPPPEVADVTDVVADSTQQRTDAWGPAWGVLAASVLAALLGAVGARVAVSGLQATAAGLLGAGAVLVVAASVLGRRGRSQASVILTAAAAGVAAGVGTAPGWNLLPAGAAGLVLTWAGLASVIVAVVGVAGAGDLGRGLGGAVGAVLVLDFGLLDGFLLTPTRSAAVIAVLGTVLVGLLPGAAMSVSGLTGLDDRVIEGQRVPRKAAVGAVEGAHRTLSWAVLTTAAVTGVCAWILAGSSDDWGRWLAVAVTGVLLLRTRVLPLAPQRLALIAAGTAALLHLLLTLERTRPGLVLAAAAVAVLLLVLAFGARISPYTAAQLRRFGGVAELVAVLALVPLLMAHLGVFSDLLRTF